MKSVVVCHSLVKGGAESYMVRLYEALGRLGVSTELIGHLPGWAEAGLATSDAQLSGKWGLSNIISGILRLPSERLRVRKFAVRSAADVFHLQFKREQIGMTRMLSRIAPVIWTEHGRWPTGFKGRLLAVAYRRAARSVSSIICVSNDVASDVSRIVGSQVSIEVVPTAIDTSHFRRASKAEKLRARSILGLATDELVGVWVGRLHRTKRPDILARIAESNLWPGTILVAGQGPELERMRAVSTRVNGFEVLGQIEDTLPLYQAADVLFFTSSGEGYPTTIVEASSCGIPTVTHESSGANTLVIAAGGVVVSDTASSQDWIMAAKLLVDSLASDSAALWGIRHGLDDWAAKHKEIIDASIDGSS